ncbi:sugar phosphate nucleotidyltransferase [Paenibacillus harenae]|uniref:Mannose-1-phosphate guanylyltransferase n=1 Tax=Paenibacillus harenae TaxID=306543 RepID=A0ABT9U4M9_PAEHA|nr:sugar phosphate nucleotidyltransferase [Paenibacillus harenae]MDQ0113399.1 mannose-1-phosphate guanylyltransferase [Paenibacillus harenae]
MRVVLLSGGSGKRLWPLSNDIRSKIYLRLLPDGGGGMESMIQRISKQLEAAGLLQSAYIMTHKSQAEITRNHIGDRIPLLTETYKRGTFTAIAMAASYFHSELGMPLSETICVIPADAYVEADFFNVLRELPAALAESGAELALIGTQPTYPSQQYGYIVPKKTKGSDEDRFIPIEQFVEKPDQRLAKRLIRQRAMWNCGVFAFSLQFMLEALQARGFPTDYKEWHALYEHLPEISFDQEVVEKTSRAIVLPYAGIWDDLGNWNTLTSHMESTIIGPGHMTDSSEQTHLINELSCPVHIIDVPNVIVAASADGILVAHKDKSSLIKERLGAILPRPMYEEKAWGRVSVLHHARSERVEVVTRKLEIERDRHTKYMMHIKRTKLWTVASGEGRFLCNGKLRRIETGDVLHIASGTGYGVKATEALVIIENDIGGSLSEEDEISLAETWESALGYEGGKRSEP